MINSFDALFYTSIFLLPGFIVSNIIDLTNPPQKYHEGVYILRCLLWSIVCCAVCSWAYVAIIHKQMDNNMLHWLLMLLVSITGAIVVAFVISISKQHNYIGTILDLVHIDTINTIPSAWDYIFSKREAKYITVHLLDGSTINGWYSSKSFSSSDTDERDLYLEKVYNDNWDEDKHSKSIYISKNQIRSIEFYNEDNASDNSLGNITCQNNQKIVYQPEKPDKVPTPPKSNIDNDLEK